MYNVQVTVFEKQRKLAKGKNGKNMKTITKLGSFDDVIRNSSDEVKEICMALKDLISNIHHECVEVPRPGEPSVAYGFGEKKMSEAYAYIMPQKDYVNLGFYHGASLRSELNILEGTGKRLRHIKVRNMQMVNSQDIRKILIDAINERRNSLGLV